MFLLDTNGCVQHLRGKTGFSRVPGLALQDWEVP